MVNLAMWDLYKKTATHTDQLDQHQLFVTVALIKVSMFVVAKRKLKAA